MSRDFNIRNNRNLGLISAINRTIRRNCIQCGGTYQKSPSPFLFSCRSSVGQHANEISVSRGRPSKWSTQKLIGYVQHSVGKAIFVRSTPNNQPTDGLGDLYHLPSSLRYVCILSFQNVRNSLGNAKFFLTFQATDQPTKRRTEQLVFLNIIPCIYLPTFINSC